MIAPQVRAAGSEGQASRELIRIRNVEGGRGGRPAGLTCVFMEEMEVLRQARADFRAWRSIILFSSPCRVRESCSFPRSVSYRFLVKM